MVEKKILDNYLFRQKCIEYVDRAFFSSPQIIQMKRRKRNLKKKEKEEKMIPQLEGAGSVVAS